MSKKTRKIFTAVLVFLLILTFIMVYVPLLFVGKSGGLYQEPPVTATSTK